MKRPLWRVLVIFAHRGAHQRIALPAQGLKRLLVVAALGTQHVSSTHAKVALAWVREPLDLRVLERHRGRPAERELVPLQGAEEATIRKDHWPRAARRLICVSERHATPRHQKGDYERGRAAHARLAVDQHMLVRSKPFVQEGICAIHEFQDGRVVVVIDINVQILQPALVEASTLRHVDDAPHTTWWPLGSGAVAEEEAGHDLVHTVGA